MIRRVDPIHTASPGLWMAIREGLHSVSERTDASSVPMSAPDCRGQPRRPGALWPPGAGLNFLVEFVFMLTSLATSVLPTFKIVLFPPHFYKTRFLHYVLAVDVFPDIIFTLSQSGLLHICVMLLT